MPEELQVELDALGGFPVMSVTSGSRSIWTKITTPTTATATTITVTEDTKSWCGWSGYDSTATNSNSEPTNRP